MSRHLYLINLLLFLTCLWNGVEAQRGSHSHGSSSGRSHSSGHHSSSSKTHARSTSHHVTSHHVKTSTGRHGSTSSHVHSNAGRHRSVSSHIRTSSKRGHSNASNARNATGRHRSTYAAGVARDKHGRIKRSSKSRKQFMKKTGYPHGRKGYVIDHIIPLSKGGRDSPDNMQWQTKEEAKRKDRIERK